MILASSVVEVRGEEAVLFSDTRADQEGSPPAAAVPLPQNYLAMPESERNYSESAYAAVGSYFGTVLNAGSPRSALIAEKTLTDIYQHQLDNGIQNFTTLASLLIARSVLAIDAGNPQEAVRLATLSRRSAPFFPQSHWALARAYWAENKFRPFRAVREWVKGWCVGIRNFPTMVVLICNLLVLTLIAFSFAVFVFALIIVGKNYRLFAYDIGGMISVQRSLLIEHVWAVSVLVFPLLIGFGPMLTALFWLMVFSWYLTKREKQVVLTIFLLLLVLPWSFRNGASLMLAPKPGITTALHRANYEDWLGDTESRLESWLINRSQDRDVIFSLGLLNKKQQNYNDAERYYTRLLALNPGHGPTLNNVSNVYLGKGRLKKAEETYQKAIKADCQVASFHYNLYRTYLELYKFLKAQQEQELGIARSLDPELMDYQERIFHHGVVNRVVIDETLPFSAFWKMALVPSEDRERLAESLWNVVLAPLPLRYGLVTFIILSAGISFLFFRGSASRISVRCDKCGRPLSRMHSASMDVPNLCANCVTLFVKFKRVDLATKVKKERQIIHYERMQKAVWTALTYGLPGGGLIWTGAPWLGFGCLLLLFMFVGKMFFWYGVFPDPYVLKDSFSWTRVIIFGACFVALYAASIKLSCWQRAAIPDSIQKYRALRGKDDEETMLEKSEPMST